MQALFALTAVVSSVVGIVHLSAPSLVVDGSAPQFSFTVGHDDCHDETDDDFIFAPADVVEGYEMSTVDGYRVVDVKLTNPYQTNGFSVNVRHKNEEGNSLTFQVVYEDPVGEFVYSKADIEPFVASKLVAKVTYIVDNQLVHPTGTFDFSITPTGTEEVDIISVNYISSGFEATIQGADGVEVEIVLAANSMENNLERGNQELRTTMLIHDPESPDCVVGGWSAFGACSGTCVSVNAKFEKTSPTRRRTRDIILAPLVGGSSCPNLVEEEICAAPLCVTDFGGRPFAGESLQDDCQTCGGRSRAGCSCSPDCIEKGDCCQAFFYNNCCEGGDCVARYDEYIYKGTFPLTCPQNMCGTSEMPSPAGSTYICFCDLQGVSDNTFCGGRAGINAGCPLFN